jgi:hypothetical protein
VAYFKYLGTAVTNKKIFVNSLTVYYLSVHSVLSFCLLSKKLKD